MPQARTLILRSTGKLTYANVTSTLALFVALAGGVAFGASAIVNSSKDVAKQAIKNSDVKKNNLTSDRLKDGAGVTGADVVADSLGGGAINEASLGPVAQANSANTLGGLAVDQFARSSQIKVGGPLPTDVATQSPVVSFPELGVEVRTDGDLDFVPEMRFVNTNAPGGPEYIVVYGADQENSFLLAPGDNTETLTGTPAGSPVTIVSRNPPSAAIFVSCAFSFFDADRRVSCIGIRA